MKKGGNPQNFKFDGTPGHKGAGGRPPDWLKAKCTKIIDKKKLIEFLGDVASGESVETVYRYDHNAQRVKEICPASIKDRIRAVEILLERGYGKVEQPLSLPVDNCRLVFEFPDANKVNKK